jgi:hypothetical protein
MFAHGVGEIVEQILTFPEGKVRAVLVSTANTVIPLRVRPVCPGDLKTSRADNRGELAVMIVTVGALFAGVMGQMVHIHGIAAFVVLYNNIVMIMLKIVNPYLLSADYMGDGEICAER